MEMSLCHLRKCYDPNQIRIRISLSVEIDENNMVISLLKVKRKKKVKMLRLTSTVSVGKKDNPYMSFRRKHPQIVKACFSITFPYA